MAISNLATIYSNPLLLIIVISIAILTFISNLRPKIYQTFKRGGGSVYSWKPVHERVQDGYQKVVPNFRDTNYKPC